MPIEAIAGIHTTPVAAPKAAEKPASGSASFSEILSGVVELANQTEAADLQDTQNLLTGGVSDLSTAIIAAEKAEIALRLTVQVRNKIVDSYNEVMRMQV